MDSRAPLSTEETNAVLTCLLGALSSDPAVQQQAEQTLQAWESRVGFCSCLSVSARPQRCRPADRPAALRRSRPTAWRAPQEIVANKAAEHSARWLAVVHLKNSISKYWRVRADQK